MEMSNQLHLPMCAQAWKEASSPLASSAPTSPPHAHVCRLSWSLLFSASKDTCLPSLNQPQVLPPLQPKNSYLKKKKLDLENFFLLPEVCNNFQSSSLSDLSPSQCNIAVWETRATKAGKNWLNFGNGEQKQNIICYRKVPNMSSTSDEEKQPIKKALKGKPIDSEPSSMPDKKELSHDQPISDQEERGPIKNRSCTDVLCLGRTL